MVSKLGEIQSESKKNLILFTSCTNILSAMIKLSSTSKCEKVLKPLNSHNHHYAYTKVSIPNQLLLLSLLATFSLCTSEEVFKCIGVFIQRKFLLLLCKNILTLVADCSSCVSHNTVGSKAFPSSCLSSVFYCVVAPCH